MNAAHLLWIYTSHMDELLGWFPKEMYRKQNLKWLCIRCMKMHCINECSTCNLNMHEHAWVIWIMVLIGSGVFFFFYQFLELDSIHLHFNFGSTIYFILFLSFCVHLPVSADQVREAFQQEVENRILLFKSNLHSIYSQIEECLGGKQTSIFCGSDYACTQGTSFWIMKAQNRRTDHAVSGQQEALIISGQREREIEGRAQDEIHLTRVYLIRRQRDAALRFLWPLFSRRPPPAASPHEWLKAIQDYFMFDKRRQGHRLLLSSSKAVRVSGEPWRVTVTV